MEVPPPPSVPSRRGSYDGEKFDLTKLLEDAGVQIHTEMFDNSAELKYGIVCPWVDEHTGVDESGTRVGQYEDGALFFHCEHSHCAGRKWAEFKDKVAPKISGWKRNPKIYVSGRLVTPNV